MFLGPQNKETGRVYVYLVGQVRLAGVCGGGGGGKEGGKARMFTGWLGGWGHQISVFCLLPSASSLC